MLDLNQFRLNTDPGGVTNPPKPPGPHQRISGHFLKGPVPLVWLQNAMRLPGKAVHVGLVLWYYSGLKRTKTLSINLSRLGEFGLTRASATRGLKALQRTGLVLVDSHAGRKPIVTILEVAPEQQDVPLPLAS